ncbi:hypothetical protein DDZ18_09955 [Marinicauda salina]|uniref:Reelin domain-containing protein n=2 Tax=Marinicauda salina TaxID=2135793 RepID=A0A2U2BSN2_9PROT|nr:hypothetical protein DDZ18_09955 [Marinicauda salina]
MVWALAGLAPALAYPDGAPWGHTGASGEGTCQSCHGAQDAVRSSTRIILEGLPEAIEPGARYALTIRLDAPAEIRGFQIAATDAGGADAGGFAAVDETVEADGARARSVSPASEWMLAWTAPEVAPSSLVFSVAMVAGNDDASPFGDVVHLRRFTIGE